MILIFINYMILYSPQNKILLLKTDIIFNINIDNIILSQVTSTKCLDIYLDTYLNCKCYLGCHKNKF